MVATRRRHKSTATLKAEYIDRLVREFGGDISVSMLGLNPEKASARNRRHVNASLLSKWPDSEPYEFSQDDPYITVIWDRYRPEDNPDRVLAKRLLINLGVYDNHVNHLWCIPHAFSGMAKPAEVGRFRPWLMDALGACGCRPTLLVGAQALWVWRPDLRLSTTHGHIGVLRSRWAVMPVENPGTLPKREMGTWVKTVRRLTDAMHDGQYLSYLATACIRCEDPVYWIDSDGVGWCRQHAVDGIKNQEKGGDKWRTLEIAGGQTGMFPNGGY